MNPSKRIAPSYIVGDKRRHIRLPARNPAGGITHSEDPCIGTESEARDLEGTFTVESTRRKCPQQWRLSWLDERDVATMRNAGNDPKLVDCPRLHHGDRNFALPENIHGVKRPVVIFQQDIFGTKRLLELITGLVPENRIDLPGSAVS